MPDDQDFERARTVADAWRSGGAHDLARELLLVTRSDSASNTLQARIASFVLATEGDVMAEDVAHALRK